MILAPTLNILAPSGLPAFDGGNRSIPALINLYTDYSYRAIQTPTSGGSLTVNGQSLGDYDWVMLQGNQTISSFSDSDWFTATQDSRSAFIFVNGDLTINSGQTLIPSVRKLFTAIYVRGTLTVNGEISMTARGANHSATGSNITAQEIRIANGIFSAVTNPSVPAAGGAGGATVSANGNPGSAGTNGGCGGGGGGGGSGGSGNSGAGGTAFTGGSGAGGNRVGTAGISTAAINGGAGGNGNNNSEADYTAGGGAGNPGGSQSGGATAGTNGTGGVGIIVCEAIAGSGSIVANGSNGGSATTTGLIRLGGGASGGGSWTIITQTGTVTVAANGGAGGVASGGSIANRSGGAGGAGTARILLTYPLDPLVTAFATTTGANNLQALDNLITYVRAQGLLNNFRLYPQKASQNYGTGSTVEGIGSLTANNMTLVGSPTWGTDGIVYNGSSQCGKIVDFLGTATLTVFAAVDQFTATPANHQNIVSQHSPAGNQRSLYLSQRGDQVGDPYQLGRLPSGISSPFENYNTAGGLGSASARTIVAQWIAGGGRELWFNNSSISISLTAGTDQTQRFNSNADIGFGAIINGASPQLFNRMTGKAVAFLEGVTPTTTQRETITDLINAL